MQYSGSCSIFVLTTTDNNKKTIIMKIEIKHRLTLEVLYSHEQEGNSIKVTIIKAIEEGANLRGAYLEGANLEGANLEGANLRGAYLRGANLRGANLRGAYLEGAYLRGANLRGANLRGANLRGADIYQVVGTGSVGRCTTYLPKNDKIICGCFYGSLAEFKNKVKDTHSGNKYEKQYLAAILFFETIAEQYK